jgi:hypothetical protein
MELCTPRGLSLSWVCRGEGAEGRGKLPTAALTEKDAHRAEAVWAEYQRGHDLSDQVGKTAGIDPETGRIWFGDSILEVGEQRAAEGIYGPLHFVRVGSDTYYRKGGRR